MLRFKMWQPIPLSSKYHCIMGDIFFSFLKVCRVNILGNVPIIVYGCSFRRDSLFQDVLKRPGTFKNVIKFSKIGQIWPGKNIQVENSLLEAELPIHGVAMRRAFKRYRRTVPAWTSAEVVRLLPCVHCVYTVYTLCVHWHALVLRACREHASVNRIFTGLFLPVLPVTTYESASRVQLFEIRRFFYGPVDSRTIPA